MAWPDAEPLGTDSEATAELPADDAGVNEHVHAAPEYSGVLHLWASRTAAADLPAANSAVDAASPATAANFTAAGSAAAAILPADGPGVDEHLHADVQHPALLRPGRDAFGSGRYPRNSTGRDKRRNKEEPEEKYRAVFFVVVPIRGLLKPYRAGKQPVPGSSLCPSYLDTQTFRKG